MKNKLSCTILAVALAALPLSFTTGCSNHFHQSQAFVDDQATTARIKSDLLRDRAVNGQDIYVSTYQGRVELTGYVASQQEKDRAGLIASSEPGVTRVHNDLVVRTGR